MEIKGTEGETRRKNKLRSMGKATGGTTVARISSRLGKPFCRSR